MISLQYLINIDCKLQVSAKYVDCFLQGLSDTRRHINDLNQPDPALNTSHNNNLPNTLPAQLEGKNVLEICNWLVDRPHIIELASKMLAAKSLTYNETSLDLYSGKKNITYDDNKLRLWDEELKCLFLRNRDLSIATLDNFIRLVCGCEPYTEEAKAITKVSRKRLGDYRNKLNTAVATLVSEFKQIKQRDQQRVLTIPAQQAIEQFIDESVVIKRVLQRYIASTNESELRRNGALTKLVKFVRECFKIHYTRKDNNRVKELDGLTKDLFIPSRSGRNLASSLKL
ncbi:hypothetical protein RhiirC2_797150 [Rhizophagus irregularis]|uniref:Uncharacterized protein n=1 Tax=Rhizophagus irregularis TaxID=588596 RepID=A0A2N1M8H4_9GLOM|nr:hypothetical protein RhiirC2_797150 [Rhizophagus irregularis]